MLGVKRIALKEVFYTGDFIMYTIKGCFIFIIERKRFYVPFL